MRALLLLFLSLAAHAQAGDAPETVEARHAYVEGVELLKKAQWSDALAAFEKSAQLRPHATTTFSIGACERALGRHARARNTFKLALSQNAATGNPMPAELVADAQSFLDEIDRLLAHVDVHLDPPESEITVDGRPLQARQGTRPVLVAGVLPPGRGTAPPAGDFELIVEPGLHVFMLARTGYSNVVVSRSFEPGSHTALPLVLSRLPATIHVAAAQPGAVITVDDLDVGTAPVEVQRAPGSYRIGARKKGFVPYSTRVSVAPGERVDLLAPLPVEKHPIYKQWWFWTGTVVILGVVVGAAVGATRPPPAYQGGSTGWVAQGQ